MTTTSLSRAWYSGMRDRIRKHCNLLYRASHLTVAALARKMDVSTTVIYGVLKGQDSYLLSREEIVMVHELYAEGKALKAEAAKHSPEALASEGYDLREAKRRKAVLTAFRNIPEGPLKDLTQYVELRIEARKHSDAALAEEFGVPRTKVRAMASSGAHGGYPPEVVDRIAERVSLRQVLAKKAKPLSPERVAEKYGIGVPTTKAYALSISEAANDSR